MVSIVWVNYNSYKFINLVLASLEGVAQLDYPKYELIVVDNGSSDGSLEKIKSFLPKLGIRFKLIELGKNYGFCKAVNEGFKARDRESKYVAILNNDAIPHPESLREMVEIAESIDRIGAIQGVVLDLKSGRIGDAGGICSEILSVHLLFKDEYPNVIPKKIMPITYTSGEYTLYKVDVIREVYGFETVYLDPGFAYFDDLPLGMAIWSKGFKCVSIPKVCAKHRYASSFSRLPLLHVYLLARGYSALLNLVNSSRTKNLAKPFVASMILRSIIKELRGVKGVYGAYLAGLRDGKKLAKLVKDVLRIDLSKVPIVELGIEGISYAVISRRKLDELVKRRYLKQLLSGENFELTSRALDKG